MESKFVTAYLIPLFLLIGSPVLAEPTIATKYNFYSIYPKKKQDLGRVIN